MKNISTGLLARAAKVYPVLGYEICVKFGPSSIYQTELLSCCPKRASTMLDTIINNQEQAIMKWCGFM